MITFLMVGVGLLVVMAVRGSKKVRDTLAKHHGTGHVLPQAISLLIISAQVSELIKVLEHVTLVNVATALFLVAILMATKSGTEGEPR